MVFFFERGENMAKTLYFGNLPWTTKEEDLSNFVAQQAEIEGVVARIIRERDTGRSKGYGFVDVSDEHASKVIEKLNGVVFDGRPLNVSDAKRKEKNA